MTEIVPPFVRDPPPELVTFNAPAVILVALPVVMALPFTVKVFVTLIVAEARLAVLPLSKTRLPAVTLPPFFTVILPPPLMVKVPVTVRVPPSITKFWLLPYISRLPFTVTLPVLLMVIVPDPHWNERLVDDVR